MATVAELDEPVAASQPPRGLSLLRAAFRNRRTLIMLVFGFAAGLPYTLLVGTLSAWLGEWKISLATIGIISWIGLAYAFKFLWSPLVDRASLPVLGKLGRRRGWLLLCQLSLAGAFGLLALTDPRVAIGTFALVAVLAAFVSATQDVVIDAWRIDVAEPAAPLELLSALYQLGYRLAGLIGGALALVLAQRIGWPLVYGVMGVLMLSAVIATAFAPDTARPSASDEEMKLRQAGALDPRVRAWGLAIVLLAWGWAIFTIGSFMRTALVAPPGEAVSVGDFTRKFGPLIVVATVILPALVAAVFTWLRARGSNLLAEDAPAAGFWSRAADHSYSALILPLAELIGRLGWGVMIALGLILTYRISDNIWGSFAFPFYLEELKYSGDEVAFASKVFGVFMTMVGITIGGLLFATAGRMPTLLLGAVLAAATNLLYADLASGAVAIDAFTRVTGLQALSEPLGVDARMLRLLVAISGENIASGLAGAAFVAYLSAIASKQYSAVQFALLSSLTFLVGSLGRAAIGEAIDQIGYAPVFQFTALLGLSAVFFCLLEWVRFARERGGQS